MGWPCPRLTTSAPLWTLFGTGGRGGVIYWGTVLLYKNGGILGIQFTYFWHSALWGTLWTQWPLLSPCRLKLRRRPESWPSSLNPQVSSWVLGGVVLGLLYFVYLFVIYCGGWRSYFGVLGCSGTYIYILKISVVHSRSIPPLSPHYLDGRRVSSVAAAVRPLQPPPTPRLPPLHVRYAGSMLMGEMVVPSLHTIPMLLVSQQSWFWAFINFQFYPPPPSSGSIPILTEKSPPPPPHLPPSESAAEELPPTPGPEDDEDDELPEMPEVGPVSESLNSDHDQTWYDGKDWAQYPYLDSSRPQIYDIRASLTVSKPELHFRFQKTDKYWYLSRIYREFIEIQSSFFWTRKWSSTIYPR